MKRKNIESYNGLEPGDFVMVLNKPSYYRIIGIYANVTENGDFWVKYRNRKAGEIVGTDISLERVLNQDGTESKRTKSTSNANRLKKIDRDVIKDLFKKLNDTLMMTLVLKERGGFNE